MTNPTFTLNAIDGTKISLMLSYDAVPFPCFMIHEFRDGQWLGGPSYGNWFQNDINPVLAEMNSMGIKAWIRKYICPWVKLALKNAYGDRVAAPGPVTPPPVSNEEITVANASRIINSVLAGAQWADTDGDGLPELVIP